MKSIFSSIGKPLTKAQMASKNEQLSDAESDIYFVERIVDKKMVNSKPRYLVKWRGWESKHNTWEPLENLTNVMDQIDRFEETKRKKAKVGQKRKAPPAVLPIKLGKQRKKELIEIVDSEDQETKVILRRATRAAAKKRKAKKTEEEVKVDEDSEDEESYEPSEEEEDEDDDSSVDLIDVEDNFSLKKNIDNYLEKRLEELSLSCSHKKPKQALTKSELPWRKRDLKKITEIQKINWSADERIMKCYVKLSNGKEEVREIEEVRHAVPQKLIDYFIAQACKHKK